MTISRILAYHVELPPHETACKWSGGKSVTVFDSTIVRGETDAGEISETQNAILGGRWNPNAALRVESVSGRQAFIFDGTPTLISTPLPAEKRDAFTGDFMLVRATRKELILAQRKLDRTWGIQTRSPLQNIPTISK